MNIFSSNILSRYVMRTVLISVLGIAAILSGLYIIFTFIAEAGDIGRGTYGSLEALEYVLLGLPANLYLIMPVAGLLGSLVGLGLLATHSELLIMRTAGLSIRRIGVGVLSAGIIIAMITFILGSFMGPWLQKEADFLKQSASAGQSFLWTSQSLWLKDGDNFVYVGKITAEGKLENVVKYNVSNTSNFNINHSELTEVISAPEANYQYDAKTGHGQWILKNAVTVDYFPDHVISHTSPELIWPSLAAPSLLSVIASNSENLTLLGLVHFVTYQVQNGLDATGYQLKLWRLIFQPLSVIVLMLMALPFVFGPLRSRALGWQLMVGLLLGLAFFFVDRFFGAFSQVYHLSPLIGASLPCLLMLILLLISSVRLA